MTESLYLVHGTTSYQVHEIANSRYGTFLGGIGMPPVAHITQRSPRQDGDTLLDVRLEPREVTIGILQWQADRPGFWGARRALLDMLKRFDGLILRLVLDDTGESYDLDVAYEAGAELGTDESIGLRDFAAAIRLRAHDPIWRSSTPLSLVAGIPISGEEAGILPWYFPIYFGASIIDADIVLSYTGTWKAYPQIDIRGPITNPTITNVTTGEKLEIGASIPDGEVVRIDLAPTQKTVRNITTDTNWMEYLSDDSDLAMWHIAADPDAPGGNNSLHFHGTMGGTDTAITVRWYNRYIGV